MFLCFRMDFLAYKDWLYFSKGQRQGIRLLIMLILMTPLAGNFIRHTGYGSYNDQEKFMAEVRQFMLEKHYKNETSGNDEDIGFSPGDTVTSISIADTSTPDANTPTININKADSLELQAIRGIGSVLGSRVVRYRELLGGFYCTSQLGEVYGIDSLRLQNILPYVITDTLTIRKININTARFGDLLRHPYLSRDQVAAITTWRENHGVFIHTSQILEATGMDTSDWEKLRPYLRLE